MSEQLIKRNQAGGYNNVMPKSWIEAINDKGTGRNLVEILQGFNMYFLSYTGDEASTRCLVPIILRKKGLWITYVKYDGNVHTEWYASSKLDDNSWGDSSNWRIGNNMLVGDIAISANGNWVINGNETEFKAIGEKGDTPLIRVANNRLQVSYDLGDTYMNVTENPIYTQFRNHNNKIQISTDLGATWTDVSDEIAAYFRWQATSGDTQANNIGRLQISRDNKTWTNLSNDIVNNLHVSRYIGINDSLPTSDIAEGTIYAKGPYYAEDDTLNDNPIYRLWVYAWKDNTLAWQDNGEFTSIAAGVVQEIGNSETEVMSQKATTEKITELTSLFGYIINNTVKFTESDKINGYYVNVGGSEVVNYDSYYTKPITVAAGTMITVKGAYGNQNYAIIARKESSGYTPLVVGKDYSNPLDYQYFVEKEADIVFSTVNRGAMYVETITSDLYEGIKRIQEGLEAEVDRSNSNDERISTLVNTLLGSIGHKSERVANITKISGGIHSNSGEYFSSEDYYITEPIPINKGEVIVVEGVYANQSQAVISQYISAQKYNPLVVGEDYTKARRYMYLCSEDNATFAFCSRTIGDISVTVYKNILSYNIAMSKSDFDDYIKKTKYTNVNIPIDDAYWNTGYVHKAGFVSNNSECQYTNPIRLKAGGIINVNTRVTVNMSVISKVEIIDGETVYTPLVIGSEESTYSYLLLEDADIVFSKLKAHPFSASTISNAILENIIGSINNVINTTNEVYDNSGTTHVLKKGDSQIYPTTKASVVYTSDGLDIESSIKNTNEAVRNKLDNVSGSVSWENLSTTVQALINQGGNNQGGGTGFIPKDGDLAFDIKDGLTYLGLASKVGSGLNIYYDYSDSDVTQLFGHESSIYILRYSHKFNGLIIPKDCVILFIGGNLEGVIQFNNTELIGAVNLKGSTISGTIKNPQFDSSWICNMDGVTDDANNIRMMLDVCNSLYFSKGEYILSSHVEITPFGNEFYRKRTRLLINKPNVSIKGNNASFIIPSRNSEEELYDKSINTICVMSTSKDGQIAENITIDGITFKCLNNTELVFQEFDHLINIQGGAKNLSVINCNIIDFFGDAICITRNQVSSDDVNYGEERAYPQYINIKNNNIGSLSKNNRNAISIIGGMHINISENNILGCSKVGMPGAIDIEPNYSWQIVDDVIVSKNHIEDSNNAILIFSQSEKTELESKGGVIRNVIITDNLIVKCENGIGITILNQGHVENNQSWIIRNNIVDEDTNGMTLNLPNTVCAKNVIITDNIYKKQTTNISDIISGKIENIIIRDNL